MTIAGVMTKFVIHELSAVDQPAQTAARATIMKRRDGGEVDDVADLGEPTDSQLKREKERGEALRRALGRAPAVRKRAVLSELETLAADFAKRENLSFAKAYAAIIEDACRLEPAVHDVLMN